MSIDRMATVSGPDETLDHISCNLAVDFESRMSIAAALLAATADSPRGSHLVKGSTLRLQPFGITSAPSNPSLAANHRLDVRFSDHRCLRAS